MLHEQNNINIYELWKVMLIVPNEKIKISNFTSDIYVTLQLIKLEIILIIYEWKTVERYFKKTVRILKQKKMSTSGSGGGSGGGGSSGGGSGGGSSGSGSGGGSGNKSLIGYLEIFEPERDNFTDWYELYENFINHNGIATDVEKIRILLMYMSKESSTKVIQACKPNKAVELSLQVVKDKCNVVFGTEFNEITLGIKFMEAKQEKGESMADYGVRIQDLANRYKFNENDLDKNLRSKFVGGLRDPAVKNTLQSALHSKLLNSFADVYNHAVNMEQFSYQNNCDKSQVCQINNKKKFQHKKKYKKGYNNNNNKKNFDNKNKKLKCYVCGYSNHLAKYCFHRKG